MGIWCVFKLLPSLKGPFLTDSFLQVMAAAAAAAVSGTMCMKNTPDVDPSESSTEEKQGCD